MFVEKNNAYSNPLGWSDNVDPSTNNDIFAKHAKELFELNMLIKRVFETEDGIKLLSWLRSVTIESVTWQPSVAQQHGIEAANATAYAREGQNALVRDLENRIKVCEKCKSPEELVNFIKGE